MRRFAWLLVTVLWAPVTWADYSDGLSAYQRGDFAEALRVWGPLTDRGDPAAQYAIGLMHRLGQGVERDYAEAVRWYSRAADQGFLPAQINLGTMYANGQGVEEDYPQAYKWFELAARQGDATAQRNRDVLARTMTPAQLALGRSLVEDWTPAGGTLLSATP